MGQNTSVLVLSGNMGPNGSKTSFLVVSGNMGQNTSVLVLSGNILVKRNYIIFHHFCFKRQYGSKYISFGFE